MSFPPQRCGAASASPKARYQTLRYARRCFPIRLSPLIGPAMRPMAYWASRRGARRVVPRRVDPRPFVAFALLAGLLGFYAYQHWTATPASPLIGRARVLDGDSLEISGARIRLEGIDAPEWRQTCVAPKGQTWSCGQTAAQELRSHIGGRELTCARHGVDRYNRMGVRRCRTLSLGAARSRSGQARHLVWNIPAAAGVATAASGMTTSGV